MIVWTTARRVGIMTGVVAGAGVIGMRVREIEVKAGMVAPDRLRAFSSRRGMRASRSDVTRTSPCGPAWMQPRRCWTGCALCPPQGQPVRLPLALAQAPLHLPLGKLLHRAIDRNGNLVDVLFSERYKPSINAGVISSELNSARSSVDFQCRQRGW